MGPIVGLGGFALWVILQQQIYVPGPDWRTIAAWAIAGIGTLLGALCAVCGLCFTLVYRKILDIEKRAEVRACEIETNTRLRAENIEAELKDRTEKLERETKELATALTLQLTADREIRDDYHNQNLLALFQLMTALKTGDATKLEPEILVRPRPRLK